MFLTIFLLTCARCAAVQWVHRPSAQRRPSWRPRRLHLHLSHSGTILSHHNLSPTSRTSLNWILKRDISVDLDHLAARSKLEAVILFSILLQTSSGTLILAVQPLIQWDHKVLKALRSSSWLPVLQQHHQRNLFRHFRRHLLMSHTQSKWSSLQCYLLGTLSFLHISQAPFNLLIWAYSILHSMQAAPYNTNSTGGTNYGSPHSNSGPFYNGPVHTGYTNLAIGTSYNGECHDCINQFNCNRFVGMKMTSFFCRSFEVFIECECKTDGDISRPLSRGIHFSIERHRNFQWRTDIVLTNSVCLFIISFIFCYNSFARYSLLAASWLQCLRLQ